MNNNSNTEFELKLKDADTIQTIIFYEYKQINYILTGGWDGIFRIFENPPNEYCIKQKHTLNMNFPIISLFHKKKSPTIFIGNVMGEVFSLDLSNNIIIHLLDLDSSIVEIFEFTYVTYDPINLNTTEHTRILTAEYDGKIQIFEYTTEENEFCKLEFAYQSEIGLFSVSLNYPILSAGLSDGNIIYFDLRKCVENIYGWKDKYF